MSTSGNNTTQEKKRTKSEARKAYWSTLTPKQRSERMRKLAISKNKKMTTKEKRDLALKMVRARLNKHLPTKVN